MILPLIVFFGVAGIILASYAALAILPDMLEALIESSRVESESAAFQTLA